MRFFRAVQNHFFSNYPCNSTAPAEPNTKCIDAHRMAINLVQNPANAFPHTFLGVGGDCTETVQTSPGGRLSKGEYGE